MNKKKLKLKIEKWIVGRPKLKADSNIIEALSSYISDKTIDSQTSEDLLLKEYFHTIDRAITTPGRNSLCALLHSPLKNTDLIENRREFISKLSSNENLIFRIKKLLWKVKFSTKYSVNHVLFERPVSLFSREKLALFLLVFVFLIITIPTLFNQLALYSILLFFIISFLVFARNVYIHNNYIPGLINLGAHYYTAKKIIKLFNSMGIEDPHMRDLKESMEPLKTILPYLKFMATGSMSSEDPLQLILFMVKNIFCLDLIAYDRALSILNRKRSNFINFYCKYGMIDSMIVLAEQLESGELQYCRADFHSERSISSEGLYHPLLMDPVANSVTINGGLILTGSNMSGKSTFLRTIGINAVLAQTIGYCHAESFRLPLLNIVSIINKKDDMNNGESFYYFEAKRIASMISLNQSENYLFLIDELLSGTNSLERVSASVSIIRHLLKMNHIIFAAATHDVSIAQNLLEECDCYYFSDSIRTNACISTTS